jgi:hypothetical protein
VRKFGKWINLKYSSQSSDELVVAKLIVRMYAHEPGAIKELEKCRINPNFNSLFRDDLEFFIP